MMRPIAAAALTALVTAPAIAQEQPLDLARCAGTAFFAEAVYADQPDGETIEALREASLERRRLYVHALGADSSCEIARDAAEDMVRTAAELRAAEMETAMAEGTPLADFMLGVVEDLDICERLLDPDTRAAVERSFAAGETPCGW